MVDLLESQLDWTSPNHQNRPDYYNNREVGYSFLDALLADPLLF